MNGLTVRLISAFFATGIFVLGVTAQTGKCLPADINEDTIVTYVATTSAKGIENSKPVTVKQALKKIKAKCYRGKLVGRKGKEVRFYQLQGCWGNPPEDYREILEKQKNDIALLRKKFTVIEITCSAGGTKPV